jgi:hypothetical protein
LRRAFGKSLRPVFGYAAQVDGGPEAIDCRLIRAELAVITPRLKHFSITAQTLSDD